MSAIGYMKHRHVFRVRDQYKVHSHISMNAIARSRKLFKCQAWLTTEEWRSYLCSYDHSNLIIQLPYLSTSSLVHTLLPWPHASCGQAPGIGPYLSLLHLGTSLLKNAGSKRIWSPGCRGSINSTPFPQPCRTDISCSFSDRIRGIHGAIDRLCVNVPPCRSRCSVWENMGHSAELTHLWYHPYHGRLVDHDRQERMSIDFPQQLKNTHSLESTSSVWQGPVMKSGVRLRSG